LSPRGANVMILKVFLPKILGIKLAIFSQTTPTYLDRKNNHL
jgi:hypothetical protein